jgi:CubicO group peptidase (beta-lactamase class C family)
MMKIIKSTIIFLCIAVVPLFGCGDDDGDNSSNPIGPITVGEPARNLLEFENRLESLREDLRIPGYSAAIAKNGKIVWAKGFGLADILRNKQAAPTISYHLASLTKTFASTVIMQLVEQGLLDLEAPVSDFGIQLSSPGTIRIKHLFTHTSEGSPGAAYSYNGDRFGQLDRVVVGASGRTFGELVVERIIQPLGLTKTAPNNQDAANFQLSGLNRAQFEENLAQGYTSDGRSRQSYPSFFGTAAGLISSAIDVATYSIAMDNNMFLTEETKAQVFSPAISTNGATLPYGLGWFVQNYRGEKLAWHYGWWTANSSLIIKVLDRELTFVLLANTDMLSRGFPSIGNGDISVSVVAVEFLNAFVFGQAVLPDTPWDAP